MIDYHIRCKEWRIKRKLEKFWRRNIPIFSYHLCPHHWDLSENSHLCQIQPLATMLAQVKQGIFCPFGRNYSSSCPLCHTCKVLLPSSADAEVTLTFVMNWADFTSPSSVSEHLWLCGTGYLHSFSYMTLQRSHFRSKKFEEKLGNADDTQMCIGVCLKGGRLSIAMFWGKRGVWGGKRKC